MSNTELQHAINNLTGNLLISLQSSWSRAEDRGLNTLYGLGYNFNTEYVAKLKKVTAQQVLDVAKKYLDPKRCAVVKILPESDKK